MDDCHCECVIGCSGLGLNFALVELGILIHQRLLLGICHAPHDSVGGNSWIVYDDTTITNWTDDLELSVLECSVLGWCLYCSPVLSVY